MRFTAFNGAPSSHINPLNMNSIITTCIKAITTEIKSFDLTLAKIKIQLETTQKAIKEFNESSTTEYKSIEMQPLLKKNKTTLKELKKNIDHYLIFEKFLLYLTQDIELAEEELHTLTNSIINYFERKEAYETCAGFVKLKQNI